MMQFAEPAAGRRSLAEGCLPALRAFTPSRTSPEEEKKEDFRMPDVRNAHRSLRDYKAIYGLLTYSVHLFSEHWLDLPEEVRDSAYELACEVEPSYHKFFSIALSQHLSRAFRGGRRYVAYWTLSRVGHRAVEAILKSAAIEHRSREMSRFITSQPGFWEDVAESRRAVERGDFVELNGEQLRRKAKQG